MITRTPWCSFRDQGKLRLKLPSGVLRQTGLLAISEQEALAMPLSDNGVVGFTVDYIVGCDKLLALSLIILELP